MGRTLNPDLFKPQIPAGPAATPPRPAPAAASELRPTSTPRPRSRQRGATGRPAPRQRAERGTGRQWNPVGMQLTKAQVEWLFAAQAQAARAHRRVSHSEVVRLAIDQARERDMAAVVASLGDVEGEENAESASYSLSAEQSAWLLLVKGHALLKGRNPSQADVVRAALQPLVGTPWSELRASLG